jgi:hypothetical protein
MGEEAHIVDRVDWAKLNCWISWTFHPNACPFEACF